MKKITLFLFAAFLCGSIAQAQYQLSNPSFESWDGTSVTARPLGWSSFPQADGTWASFASTPQHYHRNGGRPGTAGTSFVTIWTRSVLGTKANGNMTTGQIHAGATSASSSENYNYTHRGSTYCHPFSGTPDSMYVWVSFYAANASSTALVKAYIHGNSDFKSPNDESNASLYKGKAIASFTRTTSSATTRQWVQQRVPFQYTGTSTVNYVLMSLATNSNPGSGSAYDSLSVDDIEFIYSAWLDNISINWDSIATFQRGVLDYTDTVVSYALLCSSTIQFSTQVPDATTSVDTLWVNDSTRRFIIHVLAEDTVTAHDYTVTLVGPMPPCDTVSNVNAQVFVNTVSVSWTPGTNNTAYEVMYGQANAAQEELAVEEVEQPSLTLNDLDYGTEYQLFVRARCGENQYTDWSSQVLFATDTLPVLVCPAVEEITLDSLTLTYVLLHWADPEAGSTEMTLDEDPLYRVTLMQGGNVLMTNDTEDTIFAVDTLLPGTSYTVTVATVCDSENVSIPCVYSFTTLADTVGIAQDATLNVQFSISPNPATKQVTIVAQEPIRQLTVVNALGQTVYEKKGLQGETLHIDVSLWPRGLYYLTANGVGRKLLLIP